MLLPTTEATYTNHSPPFTRLPDTPLFCGLHPNPIQSPSPLFIPCPRHVVSHHPATVLLLSSSFHLPPIHTVRERERERQSEQRTSCSDQAERSRSRRTQLGMDGRSERRVAPRGGGGGGALDKTLNNRIMLRFRPIAPKPIAGGPVLDHGSTMLLSGKRAKRKYVRVRRNNRRCRHTTNSCEELQKQEGSENPVGTLKSIMENTELGEGSVAGVSGLKNVDPAPTAEKVKIHDNQVKVDSRKTIDRTVRVVDSWVAVESMTGTCMMDLGRTDDEKLKNLARDTCPGFISDGLNRLRWVNEAYKNMVVWQEEKEKPPPEIMVWLKIEDMEVYNHTAFSCKVKLQYMKENNMKCTRVVPCDAWKMDTGGFAWRLDVKAALSLGL